MNQPGVVWSMTESEEEMLGWANLYRNLYHETSKLDYIKREIRKGNGCG